MLYLYIGIRNFISRIPYISFLVTYLPCPDIDVILPLPSQKLTIQRNLGRDDYSKPQYETGLSTYLDKKSPSLKSITYDGVNTQQINNDQRRQSFNGHSSSLATGYNHQPSLVNRNRRYSSIDQKGGEIGSLMSPSPSSRSAQSESTTPRKSFSQSGSSPSTINVPKTLRKKTLVLDLDETLIHSTPLGPYRAHYLIEVVIDKTSCLYYVYKRPHVDYFLRKAGL